MDLAEKRRNNARLLPNLALALTRLVPLVMALRGRPLFTHGSLTKRLDLSPKELLKQLKAAKSPKGIMDIPSALEDAPAEPTQETTQHKESKESL